MGKAEVEPPPIIDAATASSVIPPSLLNTGEEGCVAVSEAVVGDTWLSSTTNGLANCRFDQGVILLLLEVADSVVG